MLLSSQPSAPVPACGSAHQGEDGELCKPELGGFRVWPQVRASLNYLPLHDRPEGPSEDTHASSRTSA